MCFTHKTIIVEGDYLIPDIELPENKPVGKYGRLHGDYIKEHRIGLYSNLMLEGQLNEYLHEIDELCRNTVYDTVNKMAKQEGVTEELKAINQMEWVRKMNNIRNRAEEVVFAEIVYSIEI